MIPSDLKYSSDHEWVRGDGPVVEIGITHFAQDQLGDIVFVEVPEVGATLSKGDTFGVVESVKTVSDLFAPVSGKVVESNEKLMESSDDYDPELVNREPYGGGWMVKVELSDSSELSDLLDHEGYAKVVAEES